MARLSPARPRALARILPLDDVPISEWESAIGPSMAGRRSWIQRNLGQRNKPHPLYLALTLIYAGIALMVNSIWALLLLIPINIIISRFVIQREEEYLERTFGEDYKRYKTRVRRWI